MWPSTCASSVDTWCEKGAEATNAPARATRATTTMTFQGRREGAAGRGTDTAAGGAETGAGEGGSAEGMGSLAAGSVAIDVLRISNAAREVGPCLVEAIEGLDAVVVGTGEGVLGGDDLDVRGDTGCEPPRRPLHLLPREGQAELGHGHGFPFRAGLIERGLDLPLHGVLQVSPALPYAVQLEPRPLLLGPDPSARPERQAERVGEAIAADAVVQLPGLVLVEAGELQARPALVARGLHALGSGALGGE